MAEKQEKSRHIRSVPEVAQADDWYRRQAELLSARWEDRLDNFHLPCPLCKGIMQFQGARRDEFYEFAEGEAGTVTPIHVLALSFVCNLCGYTAEFDAELFNPSYLAKLQGAEPDRVAALSTRAFRVLVPLTGKERSETLLDLASAVAGVRHGEVLALNVATDPAESDRLNDKLQRYRPAVGDPVPMRLLLQQTAEVGDAIVHATERQRCQLVLIGWRGWTRNPEVVMGTILDPVLNEAVCDVAIVHDRGLPKVRRILLATAGGPNVRVALPLALDLARAFNADLHLLHVVSPKQADPENYGQAYFAEILRDVELDESVSLERHITVDADPVRAIVQESSNYDLVVIGASHRDWRGRIRRTSMVAKIARNCSPTSIVVSARQSAVSSWFARFFT